VLALQGGVAEHFKAIKEAAAKAKINISPRLAHDAIGLDGLDALLMPGGESTTLSKLLDEGNMLEKIKKIPNLFGTCAGLILMAKEVEGGMEGQKGLGLLDAKVSRNAYGAQVSSFEAKINAPLFGKINAVFIRAPKILSTGPGVDVLASYDGSAVIVEQKTGGQYLLGCTFHPELTTTKVHGYFLRQVARKQE